MRVFLLANADATTSGLFRPLCSDPRVTITGVAYTATLTRATSFWAGLREIYQACDRGFFLYQLFRNGVHLFKEKLSSVLPIGTDPSGRYFSLKAWARANHVPFYVVADFNAPEFIDAMQASAPDVTITRVNQILRKPILEAAKGGCWCVHSSMLPEYRGIAAEFHAMANGDSSMGCSVMQMDERLDRGAIIVQERIAIPSRASLHEALELNARNGIRVLSAALDALADERMETREQDGAGSYYSWPTPQDGRRFRAAGRRYVRLPEMLRYLAR